MRCPHVWPPAQVMHSSKVYTRLAERLGLEDHSAVLSVMLTKVREAVGWGGVGVGYGTGSGGAQSRCGRHRGWWVVGGGCGGFWYANEEQLASRWGRCSGQDVTNIL